MSKPLTLAFCAYKIFPFGGLERDCLRMAKACAERGHHVTIYTMEWEGERPDGIHVEVLPQKALSNYQRYEKFSQQLSKIFVERSVDVSIGFNRLANLDVYFSGDSCFVHRKQGLLWPLLRWMPRNKSFCALERAIFSPHSATQILSISDPQKALFKKHYQTPAHRFMDLPPGIDRKFLAVPENRSGLGDELRHSLGIGQKDFMLLMVGSGFKTKGLDRSLEALGSLPSALRAQTHLVVVGQDNPKPFWDLAETLSVKNQLHMVGGQQDVERYYAAADVLLHPAYAENTGGVLLEAMVSGVPVLTTAVCGYARYVSAGRGGEVLPSPFFQKAMNQILLDWLQNTSLRMQLGQQAHSYATTGPIFYMMPTAVEAIETVAANKMKRWPYQGRQDWSLDDIHAWIKSHQGEYFRDLPRRKTLRFVHEGKSYFAKLHFGVGWKELFKNLTHFKWPAVGATPEWRAIQACEQLGIPTMTPVDYDCHHPNNPAKQQSYIVTHEITDTVDMETLGLEWKSNPPEFKYKHTHLQTVATMVKKLHGAGINHRDLYIVHFLKKQDRNCQIHLIDLHRAQLRGSVPRRWLVKDLASLYYSVHDFNLTQRDIFRFLKYYFDQPLRSIFLENQSLISSVRKKTHRLLGRVSPDLRK